MSKYLKDSYVLTTVSLCICSWLSLDNHILLVVIVFSLSVVVLLLVVLLIDFLMFIVIVVFVVLCILLMLQIVSLHLRIQFIFINYIIMEK
jgi:hypothetical protein